MIFLIAENIPGGRYCCAIGPSDNGDGLAPIPTLMIAPGLSDR